MINFKEGMAAARIAAMFSDDPDTQTGCAIFNPDGQLLATGCNKLPSGIQKTDKRVTRPEKYNWIEHSERTAIYRSLGDGTSFRGATMFLNWYPCADCARAIVAVGIGHLVYIIKPERLADPRYGFEAATAILKAGYVELIPFQEEAS